MKPIAHMTASAIIILTSSVRLRYRIQNLRNNLPRVDPKVLPVREYLHEDHYMHNDIEPKSVLIDDGVLRVARLAAFWHFQYSTYSTFELVSSKMLYGSAINIVSAQF